MRWDDIATVAAAVRTGSFLGAARELGVRHSSISRRIAAIEDSLGEALFVRGRRLAATALARDIADHAVDMAAAARRLEASVSARRSRRAAEVVVTTNDVLAPLLLRALATTTTTATFRLVVTDVERDLEPGTTDLALRPTGAPKDSLRGRRLGTLAIGVFQSKRAHLGDDAPWIQPSADLRSRASTRWLRAVPPDPGAHGDGGRGAIECDRILTMRDACLAGLGRAVLPRFLASDDPRLELVRPLEEGTPIWLFVAGSRPPSASLARVVDELAHALAKQPGVWHRRRG